MKGGQAPAHKHIDTLLRYVVEGKVKLDDIITHRLHGIIFPTSCLFVDDTHRLPVQAMEIESATRIRKLFAGVAVPSQNTMDKTQDTRMNLPDASQRSKRVLLYLEMHLAPRLRAGRYSEETDVVDHQATEVAMQAVAHDLYEPVNEMLLKVIATQARTKVAVAASGQNLEQISKHAPQVMEGLKRLNESGVVEWLGLPYNNSVSILVSEDVYKEEVLRTSDAVYQHFGVRPKVLLAAPFFESSMLSLAAAMGFEALLVKPGVWPGRSVTRDETGELTIICTDERLTNTISQHFGAGDATLTLDKFTANVNAASDDIVAIGLTYDVFRAHREAGILRFFEKFLTRAAKEGCLIHPSDITHQKTEPLAEWPANPVVDTATWLGNEMQRDALAACRVLDDATRHLLDTSIRKSWLQLLAADHFMHMSPADAGLTSPYLSPYEAFTNYLDLLKNLEKALENAPLAEDDKTVKAVECERQHPTTPIWASQEQSKYQEVTRSHI